MDRPLGMMSRCLLAFFFVILWLPPAAFPGDLPARTDQAALDEAVEWMRAPRQVRVQYDYIMTARVRLLFFWVGWDDVGGGYIRLGASSDNPRQEFFQVLFGSDPAKAPRAINRWGAGTEVALRREAHQASVEASAFVGFMKPSRGTSAAEMEKELSAEQGAGRHLFEAIVSHVDRQRALAKTVPFHFDQDLNLHEFERAEKMIMPLLSGRARPVRRWSGSATQGCETARGFLSTMQELFDRALESRRAPLSLCFLYNARRYTATLERLVPVAEKTLRVKLRGEAKVMERTYRHLLEARFQVFNHESGGRTYFQVLLAASGPLRGVPLQISYQPNWWFQVILHLKPQQAGTQAPNAASGVCTPP